jgi:uncharacterized protein (TIGR00369 family)
VTGLEQMQAIVDGSAPKAPISGLMGFDVVAVSEGTAAFEGVTREDHLNPLGTVHAGFAMTLLDSAAGCCVHTTLADGEAYTTLETKVNLTRALLPDTPVRCEGTVVHRGRTIATSEARLVGRDDGKLYAHAVSTCLIMGADGR